VKIVFIGGVEIGYTVLKAVYVSNYIVDTLFTLPQNSTASGYKNFSVLANEHQTKLVRTNNINEENYVNLMKNISPDLIIVCGWQQLVSQEILDIPKLGVIGFHSSLLPKYRGRAPVNWAIIMGEKEIGITMFYLTAEADAGDIIAQRSFSILFNDDCGTVYKKSATAGAELINEYLPKIENGTAPREHNPSQSYPAYPNRTPEDGLIDFNRSALDVYNFVRALTKPYPGAFYFDKNGNKVIVWSAKILFESSEERNNDIIFKTLDFDVLLNTAGTSC